MDDPQVDDYVRWGDIEGWVYFKDSNHYITIEIGVRPNQTVNIPVKRNTNTFTLLFVASPGIGMN